MIVLSLRVNKITPKRFFLALGFFFSLLLLPNSAFSSGSSPDSLLALLETEKDTVKRADLCISISDAFQSTDYESALLYAKRALGLYKKADNKKGMARAHFNIGYSYTDLGNLNESVEQYKSALKLYEEIKDTLGTAKSLNDLGYLSQLQGKSQEAFAYYKKALDFFKALDDKENIAATMNNIGLLLHGQGDYKNALHYYSQSAVLKKELGNKKGLAMTYNNIGALYIDQKNFDMAFQPIQQSLQLRKEIGDKAGIAQSLVNFGSIFRGKKNYPQALSFFLKALEIQRELGNRYDLCINLSNIGALYTTLDNDKLGLKYSKESNDLAMEMNSPDLIYETAKTLSHQYYTQGKYKESLEKYKQYEDYEDTLNNIETTRKLTEVTMQAEFDNTMKQKEFADAQIQIAHEAEIARQQTFIWAVVAVLFLTAGFLVFVYSRMRIISRQKDIIVLQKKDITDSIKYAKRIQEAILPSQEQINILLPESFVLYKPKDIVSGDFFWFERFGSQVFAAAVDCTGHGVPGAFMSIVGYNLLNQALNEQGLYKPHLMLNAINKSLTKTLRQTFHESAVKDGMDIALCSIDYKRMIVEFAGAYNPLYIVRNRELLYYPGNKFPIGAFIGESMNNFTNNEIELMKGDMIYLMTDGFADQFGGPAGKKFMYRRLEELFTFISIFPPEDQKIRLNEVFEKWKGPLEQLDDVCIIGIRI
jgi:serine phosphatase RsbU (regulator of sigma subunit)/tetratricopeptide (TPR) repeat protein